MFGMLFTVTFFTGFMVILRCICKNHVSAGLRYALWILVAVKLLIFPVPNVEGYFSVWGLVTEDGNGTVSQAEISKEELQKAEAGGPAAGMQEEGTAVNGNLWDTDGQNGKETTVYGTDSGAAAEYLKTGEEKFSGLERWMQVTGMRLQNYMENILKVPVWLILISVIGSAISAVIMAGYHIRLGCCLRRERTELKVENLLPERKKVNSAAAGRIEKRLAVYSVAGLPTPCLFGRSIYVPERLAEDKELLPYILQHEKCHYVHGDNFWGFLRMVCICLYWYHPLVWLAAYLSRQDCELACDEAVVRKMTGEERKCYGELLLEFALVKNSPADCFSMTTAMSGNARNLKERLCRITGKKKKLTALGIIAVILGAAGVWACVTSGFVSPDKQWQSVEIRKREGNMPLQGDYEVEYRFSQDAASCGLYIEEYAYGELVSAEILECMTLLPEGKVKKGEVTFSRTLESDETSGAFLKAAVSYSLPDFSVSEGASSVFRAFTLELPENCIGNAFDDSSAESPDNRFRMNEDIVLMGDYYGGAAGHLLVPAKNNLPVEKYMEWGGEKAIKGDGYVILVHLIVSDKIPEELEKDMGGANKKEKEQAAPGDTRNGEDTGDGESAETEGSGGYSNEELLEMAENYYRQEHGFTPEHIEIDSENGNQVIIWLYDVDEFLNEEGEIIGNANTRDWYTVDRVTGRGEDVLFEEVDLTDAGFRSRGWNGTAEEMTIVDVREQEEFSALPAQSEAGEQNRLYLLGETDSYRLYGAGDYQSMILEEGDAYTEIKVPFIVDGIVMQASEVQEADYDGDGEAELAVKLLWGVGTGIWEEELWVLDKEDGQIKAYAYHNGTMAGEMLRQLSWAEKAGRKWITLDGQAISPGLQEEEWASYEEMTINTSQVSFALQDGKISVRTLIACGREEGSVMPAYGNACLEAEVVYRDKGGFSLSNVESADLKKMEEAAQEAVKRFYAPRQIEIVDVVHSQDIWTYSAEEGESTEITLTVLEDGTDSYDYATVTLVREETGEWSAVGEVTVEK